MSTKRISGVLMAACIVVSLAGLARGETIVLARTGQDAPSPDSAWSFPGSWTDPDGVYLTFTNAPVLNSFGQIAFQAHLEGTYYGEDSDTAIFRVDSEEGRLIAQKGLFLPSWHARFESFAYCSSTINDLGQVAFWSQSTDGLTGIYCGTGDGWPTQVVRENDPLPDGNGRFDSIPPYDPIPLDMAGNVAFQAVFKDTAGGAADNTGIVVTKGSVPRVVAREGSPAPDGAGEYVHFDFPSHVALGCVGGVAFLASTTGSSGGEPATAIFGGRNTMHMLVRENTAVPGGNGVFSTFSRLSIVEITPYEGSSVVFRAFMTETLGGPGDDDIGLFRHGIASPSSPSSLITEIVRTGESPPDGNGQYHYFGSNVSQTLNGIAFRVQMRNTSNPGLDSEGIYRSSFGGQIVKIARAGEPAPDGNGVLNTLYPPVTNSAGQVAFQAWVWDTAGGYSDDEVIYVGNGLTLLTVAREGDSLLGSTITELHFATGPQGRNGLNEYCQVAYKVVLADGREALMLTTPLVEYSGGANGDWSDKDNWTLGIAAAEVHDVVIAPGHSVEVAGPRTYTTIKSLTLGTPDGGTATLNLTGGGDLTALGEIAIGPNGHILVGAGRALTAAALLNQGILAFEAGQGHVLGNVTNGPGGQILVAAGANAWMHGPLENTGVVEVAPGGEVHLLGLAGNGPTGGGTTWLEGDVRPGSYIGQMGFEGDVVLGRGCVMHIELGGLAPGTGHDQLNIGGAATLGGTLALSLINNFTPQVGDEFEIMTYGSAAGEFADTTSWPFDGNKALVKVHGANALTLFATYQGDATLDFCVDGLDYVAWSSNYLTGGTWQEGDFNADGYVDGLDYIVWSTNYEQGCPGQVPEPSVLLLLALGGLAVIRDQRSRRSTQVGDRR